MSIELIDCGAIKVTDNIITAPPQHGIKITDTSFSEILGNLIANPGFQIDDTFDGIVLDGDSNQNSVQDNTVTQFASSVTRYGINVEDSTCDLNIIADNWLGEEADYGTASYNDAGTNTITDRDVNGQFTDNPVAPGGGASDLDDLTDVDTTGAADGDVLTYDSGTSSWGPEAPTGGASDLASLTDVDLTGLADEEILQYDSGTSTWVAVPIPVPVIDVSDLGDVDLTGLADDEVLAWDAGTSTWRPITNGAGGGVVDLDDLGDVDLTGIADGDVLVWDAGTSSWVVAPPPSGGGGGSYQQSSPPGTPDAFDEEFTTDPTGGWTWLNQSTAAVAVASDALVLSDSRNTNDVSFIGVAPPSGSYTIETMIYPWLADTGSARSGAFLAVRYTSTINGVGWFTLDTPYTLTWATNGTGVAVAQSSTPFTSTPLSGPYWARFAWNNGTGAATWSLSMTGIPGTYYTMHTFTPGSTPDLVGFAGIFNRNHLIAYTFEYLRRVA